MHIPDGYLGLPTYGSLWAAMIPAWMVASRRVKKEVHAAQIPFVAMASSFSLLVMLFTIPLPGGTTGHITGSPLVAILLGPWVGVLAVSVALAIQALLFGDGGITTLGANCFNVALAESFVAYGTYRAMMALSFKVSKRTHPPDEKGGREVPLVRLVSAGVSAYLAINTGALLTALELGLQPILHPGSGTASYFPFPFNVTLPAVLIPHLTVVGGLEVMITVLVVLFLQKIQPGMTRGFKLGFFVLLSALFFLPATGKAHEFWIEKKGQEFIVVFGHGTHREEFDMAKIKETKAFDADGKETVVSQQKKGKEVILRPSDHPALMVAEIDNGYWSKTIYGWKNLPKRKASRVVEANRSLNYAQVLLSWSDGVQRVMEGLALGIVPMKNPLEMKPGEMLPVKILRQGKPLTGIEVFGTDHARVGTTEADGKVKIHLSRGLQLITVTHREALKGDPDADYLSVTSTLTFEVMK